MGPIPFAFSVSHFINSVGADAGFASIIGLAVLVLLYFAQARETASLREQAYESAQRVQQLETRLAGLAQQQTVAPQAAPVGTPARAPAARPLASPVFAATASGGATPASGSAATAVALAPVAPAGVGAPALTAATRLIPATAVDVAQPAVAAGGPLPDRPPGTTAVVAPPPATVAGGANGTMQERVPAASVAAGPAPGQPPPRVQIRPGGTAPGRRPPVPARGQAARGTSSGGRRALVALLVVLAVGGVVAVLLILTSGSGSTSNPVASKPGRASNAPVTHHRSKPPAFNPSNVTVAVLNGTATSGLAHRVALKLGGAGYKQGTVATAADQTHTATVLAYMPGHKSDAVKVAATLKLGPASVQPVDQNTQAVACPQPSACAATDVVVTVGSDLANTQ